MSLCGSSTSVIRGLAYSHMRPPPPPPPFQGTVHLLREMSLEIRNMLLENTKALKHCDNGLPFLNIYWHLHVS